MPPEDSFTIIHHNFTEHPKHMFGDLLHMQTSVTLVVRVLLVRSNESVYLKDLLFDSLQISKCTGYSFQTARSQKKGRDLNRDQTREKFAKV